MPQMRESDQQSGAGNKSVKDGMFHLSVETDHGDKNETNDRSSQKVAHQASAKIFPAQDVKTFGKDNNVDT
jgi:hypothetical protein